MLSVCHIVHAYTWGKRTNSPYQIEIWLRLPSQDKLFKLERLIKRGLMQVPNLCWEWMREWSENDLKITESSNQMFFFPCKFAYFTIRSLVRVKTIFLEAKPCSEFCQTSTLDLFAYMITDRIQLTNLNAVSLFYDLFCHFKRSEICWTFQR